MITWHSQTTSADQGLIIDDETGRNVAVSYDVKDAKLLAAAPELLEALKNLLGDVEFTWNEIPSGCVGLRQVYAAREAISKATEG